MRETFIYPGARDAAERSYRLRAAAIQGVAIRRAYPGRIKTRRGKKGKRKADPEIKGRSTRMDSSVLLSRCFLAGPSRVTGVSPALPRCFPGLRAHPIHLRRSSIFPPGDGDSAKIAFTLSQGAKDRSLGPLAPPPLPRRGNTCRYSAVNPLADSIVLSRGRAILFRMARSLRHFSFRRNHKNIPGSAMTSCVPIPVISVRRYFVDTVSFTHSLLTRVRRARFTPAGLLGHVEKSWLAFSSDIFKRTGRQKEVHGRNRRRNELKDY